MTKTKMRGVSNNPSGRRKDGSLASTAWRPGKSASPAGLPAFVKEIRRLAGEHGPKAVRVLAKIMEDESAEPPARIAAACALLDRAGARPLALEGDKLEVAHTVDVEALRAQLAARVVRLVQVSQERPALEVASTPAPVAVEATP